MILPQFLALVAAWRPAFHQARTQAMAVRMALALLCVLGRNTISQRIVLLGAHLWDWSKFYRLFSRQRWETTELFGTVITNAQPWCPGEDLVVAGDDTLVHKTGKQIYHVGYLRDPLSPKFRYNLVLGLRYIQLSLLLPLYSTYPEEVQNACALPVRFALAAVIRKPKGKRKLTEEEQAEYERVKQENTLSKYMWELITGVRTWMDEHDLKAKRLLMVLDSSYCTRTIFATAQAGIALIARTKSNSRLYLVGEEAGAGFTPTAVRTDKARPWEKGEFYFGNARQILKYKEVRDIVWPGGADQRVLRLIVIAATPYRRRKHAALSYRQPGYLLTTDCTSAVEYLIQCYLNRWQIEVNHRDEKTVLGVGQAQVSNQESVEREPAFAVASYSLLKLASLQALGPTRTADYAELPAWYAGSSRPSCEDLLQKLRQEARQHPELLAPYGVHITAEGLIAALRA